MPTSVWLNLARKNVELPQLGKANDERRLSLAATRSCCPTEHSAKRPHLRIAKRPFPGCRFSLLGGALVRLEPCEGKLSRLPGCIGGAQEAILVSAPGLDRAGRENNPEIGCPHPPRRLAYRTMNAHDQANPNGNPKPIQLAAKRHTKPGRRSPRKSKRLQIASEDLPKKTLRMPYRFLPP